MRGYGSALRKFSLLMSALILSLCLFAAITSARLENSLFDAELHKKLLSKCDIYSQTGNILNKSLGDYLKTLDSGSSESLKQQEQLVEFIKKAITPEMLKMNIDSIIEGLLKYFKSETRFLPDIFISPVQDKPLQELQTNTRKDDRISEEALTQIDKINLSVLLMYMNRSDITDKLSVVRLFQFALSRIPHLAALLFVLALLSGLLFIKNKSDLARLVNTTALITGCAFAASGVSLFIYLYYVLPANHSFISLSVPIQADTAVIYIQNWLYSSALFFIIAGIAAIMLVFLIKVLTRHLPIGNNIDRLIMKIPIKSSRIKFFGGKLGIKPVFAAVSFILILLFTFLYFGSLKSEFLSRDLTVAVERMKGVTAFSRVVYAQDAAVNTLELRMVDRKTNTPLQGIYTKITGKSSVSGNSFSEDVTSDSEGKSKTTLDIGSYKLSFDSTQFPDDYILPPPYLFEMEAAGSTVITISLDKIEEPKQGTIEVQILGKDNLAVEGIELELANTETENGASAESSTYSFTNSEGVAAFKAEEGVYRISFLGNGFPAEYLLPEPLEIDLASDKTARYSIKLAKVTLQSGKPADKKQKTK